MRRLLLMRHAKSDWAVGVGDLDRPLNARGRRDAPRMAHALAARDLLPDRVWCSEAARTRETLAYLETTVEHPWNPSVLPSLYLAGVGDLLAAASRSRPDDRTVLVLAHNPGLEDAVQWLSGRAEPMPTSAVAVLHLPATMPWRALADRGPRVLTLATVLRPKDLTPDGEDG